MSDASTCPSSITSPVLIRLAARSTLAGFAWLAEPRSSAAPHFDGHRWLSAGGCHDGACAFAAVTATVSTMARTMRRMGVSSLAHRLWQDAPTEERSMANGSHVFIGAARLSG